MEDDTYAEIVMLQVTTLICAFITHHIFHYLYSSFCIYFYANKSHLIGSLNSPYLYPSSFHSYITFHIHFPAQGGLNSPAHFLSLMLSYQLRSYYFAIILGFLIVFYDTIDLLCVTDNTFYLSSMIQELGHSKAKPHDISPNRVATSAIDTSHTVLSLVQT